MMSRMLILFLCITTQQLFAQQERSYVRKGNQKYIEGKYEEAEREYNKALDIKNNLTEGVFNLGDVAYQSKDYEKAIKQFETAAMLAKNDQLKAKAYHNIGNSYLDAGQYDKSIDAYKNSLRLNPGDMDTKYNLAYAQRMLEENPQQNQQNQDKQDQDKEDQQKDKQDQQDQENQDQQDQQQAEQDKKEQQQNQQQQSQEQQAKEEEQQQQQPREAQISKEDAQRLLEALMQEEQKVQEQIVNKKLPPAEKRKVEKDW